MAIRKGKVEGADLKSLLENIKVDQSVYIRLHTAAQDAAEVMNNHHTAMSASPHMHAVNVVGGGGGGGGTYGNGVNSGSINVNPWGGTPIPSGSFTFIPTDGDMPVVRMSRPGFYMVGDREISTVVLLMLVDEFFKKQERIANPPKFDSPEQAQEWLDSVT